MTGREVAEDEGSSDVRAGARIAAPHHRRGRIAGSVEAVDRRTIASKNPRVLVCHKTAESTDIARIDRNGVERTSLDRTQARVRFVGRIAERAIVGAVATPKVQVLSGPGKQVEKLDSATQGCGVEFIGAYVTEERSMAPRNGYRRDDRAMIAIVAQV